MRDTKKLSIWAYLLQDTDSFFTQRNSVINLTSYPGLWVDLFKISHLKKKKKSAHLFCLTS